MERKRRGEGDETREEKRTVSLNVYIEYEWEKKLCLSNFWKISSLTGKKRLVSLEGEKTGKKVNL